MYHQLQDYNYQLPKDLIAQTPHTPADECRLLFVNQGNIKDKIFKNISDIIDPNTLIVFNNSKVIKARIPLKNTKIITKDDQEKILSEGEIFFLKQHDEYTFEALVKPGKKLKPGTTLAIPRLRHSE